MAAETITIADRARDVLARFGPPSPEYTADRAERVAWAVARFDGGDHDGAAEELTALLEGWLPEPFATAAPRILTGECAVKFVTAALGGDHPYRPFVSGRSTPEYAVAGTLARLVAGHADAEEALLRTVLGVRPGERPSAHLRVARISATFAALAEAHAGKPELLDGWAALLDEEDRPRLAAAAALLGPLGLAETDQRCGAVEDVDGERLVVAFAGADRFDDALALATRLGPSEQQRSLLALATPGLPAARAKALVAAFRKCPKRSRERDDQMVYQHRFARLFLALDRIDDAVAVLGRMRDCRISGYGPALLAREVLRWLDGRRAEATSERLRAVLDVLAGDRVIPQELAAVVAEAVPLAHALADEPLRAEIVEVRVPRLRARLRVLRWWQLADAGLATVLVDAGDRTAADRLFAEAAGGRPGPQLSRLLARLAVRTGLPARDRDLFAGLLSGVFAEGHWSVEAVLPVLDAEALAAVPAAAVAGTAGDRHDRVVVAVARFAEQTGDLDLLGAMLDAASNAQSAFLAAGRAAMALARRGELRDAVDVARRCGLVAGG